MKNKIYDVKMFLKLNQYGKQNLCRGKLVSKINNNIIEYKGCPYFGAKFTGEWFFTSMSS